METSWCDIRVFNIVILGISFLLIFSAFQTCEMIQEVVLESLNDKTFRGSGFKSLSLIYGSFAIFNWFAAPLVMWLGLKWSLILGGSTYCIYIGTFLSPNLWSLYASSCLLGFGAAILWTAQGTFITLLSNSATIERNTGIFWSLFQTSLVVGNAIMFFKFCDHKPLNKTTYEALYTILLILSCMGWIFIVAFLKAPPTRPTENTERSPLLTNENVRPVYSDVYQSPHIPPGGPSSSRETTESPLSLIFRLGDKMSLRVLYDQVAPSFRLFKDRHIVLLTFAFAFTGLGLTFVSGILITCVGYNLHWGKRSKALMGICGMLVGVGEILGGINLGILKTVTDWFRTSRATNATVTYQRSAQGARTSAIATVGYVLNLICYFTLYLTLPYDSPMAESSAPVFVSREPLSTVLVCVSSLLLGFADSALNTQLYVVIGTHYAAQSAPVFALFKFVQCVAAACSFYYSKYLQLHWQLLILATTATMAIYTFMAAEDDLCYGKHNAATTATFGADTQHRQPMSRASSITSLSSSTNQGKDQAGPHWVDIRY